MVKALPAIARYRCRVPNTGFRVLPETKRASPVLAPSFPFWSDFLQPPGDIFVQHTGDEGLVGHSLP